MSDDLQQKIHDAIANPKNVGEMENADSVGTVGSPDCGDMLRMWVKFKEEDGRKVIDRATFQTFGCETAIAVASVATELIAGKTVEEALSMSGAELSAPLGALPPMKIHCAQLVEGALRSALTGTPAPQPAVTASTLVESFTAPPSDRKVKIVLKENSKRQTPDSKQSEEKSES
jgi:nitrogen fixation protein NifU and related proteins